VATVNNCAGARAPQQDSDGFQDAIALSASSVFPPRRARSANDPRRAERVPPPARRASDYQPALSRKADEVNAFVARAALAAGAEGAIASATRLGG